MLVSWCCPTVRQHSQTSVHDIQVKFIIISPPGDLILWLVISLPNIVYACWNIRVHLGTSNTQGLKSPFLEMKITRSQAELRSWWGIFPFTYSNLTHGPWTFGSLCLIPDCVVLPPPTDRQRTILWRLELWGSENLIVCIMDTKKM